MVAVKYTVKKGRGSGGRNSQVIQHTISYITETLCYIHTYTIVLQFYNIFLYTPNKYLTSDNHMVSTMETQIFM